MRCSLLIVALLLCLAACKTPTQQPQLEPSLATTPCLAGLDLESQQELRRTLEEALVYKPLPSWQRLVTQLPQAAAEEEALALDGGRKVLLYPQTHTTHEQEAAISFFNKHLQGRKLSFEDLHRHIDSLDKASLQKIAQEAVQTPLYTEKFYEILTGGTEVGRAQLGPNTLAFSMRLSPENGSSSLRHGLHGVLDALELLVSSQLGIIADLQQRLQEQPREKFYIFDEGLHEKINVQDMLERQRKIYQSDALQAEEGSFARRAAIAVLGAGSFLALDQPKRVELRAPENAKLNAQAVRLIRQGGLDHKASAELIIETRERKALSRIRKEKAPGQAVLIFGADHRFDPKKVPREGLDLERIHTKTQGRIALKGPDGRTKFEGFRAPKKALAPEALLAGAGVGLLSVGLIVAGLGLDSLEEESDVETCP